MTIRVIELYCNNDKSSIKSKHIDIKFLVNNDEVQNHILSVDSVSTILNIANSFIKGLSPKIFLQHIVHMEMASHEDIVGAMSNHSSFDDD